MSFVRPHIEMSTLAIKLSEITAESITAMQRIVSSLDIWSGQSTLLLPIILSFIAALIFWATFSYFPEKARRKKLRPIVELALFDAYKILFSFFDLVLKRNNSTPSFHQSKIRSGLLSRDEIEIGLANKCLNESYLFYEDIRDQLCVIGQEIFDKSNQVEELANKVLSFHTYASASEIILLEKLREKLRVYDFAQKHINRNAISLLGDRALHPVNPSLSYRASNYYEIYELFCALQTIVLGKEPPDRDRFLYKIQALFYSGRFKECRRFIKAHGHRFSKDETLSQGYLALSERALGNHKTFYSIVDGVYKARPYNGSLVTSRWFFSETVNDKKMLEVLGHYHSAEEISAMKAYVEKDQRDKAAYEKANRSLQEYYQEKLGKVSAGGADAA